MLKARLYRFADLGAGPIEVEVPEALFGAEVNEDLLWRAVRIYLLNQRQGTAATKTRGEVSGGGRKPWAQKHTGRARQGSIRSPIWRHGGVTFGPKPGKVRLSLPKKMRRAALASALSARFRDGNVWLIDRIGFERPRTKDGIALLSALGCPEKTLVVVAEEEKRLAVEKSFQNVPGVDCVTTAALTPYEVLRHDGLLLTEEAMVSLARRVDHG